MQPLTTTPRFKQDQQVGFIGGIGKIIYCQADGKDWLYGIEMPLGIEPDMGRIGHETIVLMLENEIFDLVETIDFQN